MWCWHVESEVWRWFAIAAVVGNGSSIKLVRGAECRTALYCQYRGADADQLLLLRFVQSLFSFLSPFNTSLALPK